MFGPLTSRRTSRGRARDPVSADLPDDVLAVSGNLLRTPNGFFLRLPTTFTAPDGALLLPNGSALALPGGNVLVII